MFLNLIHTVLWYCIHYLYSIFSYIKVNYNGIKRNLIQKKFKGPIKVLEYIEEHTKSLEKIPKHLSVLIGNEDPSVKDLSKLIVWSIASGISFISFYDMEGKLKSNEEKLQLEIENDLMEGYHIIWHKGTLNGYRNGYSGKKIHVKLLSASDGREKVADTCKQLIKSDTIDIDTVDAELNKQFQFPDPNLGLYCGTYFNLRGYPPWQIRLTEFLMLQSHHNLKVGIFIDALRRYNNCDERFGT